MIFAIRWGILKDIDKLPVDAKRYGSTTVAIKPHKQSRIEMTTIVFD
jgi:hypothetical protein